MVDLLELPSANFISDGVVCAENILPKADAKYKKPIWVLLRFP